MRDDDAERTARARRFGEFTSRAARAADYDIDSPRGGGKRDLANASGISRPTISRMLSGKAIPNPQFFPGLAKALGMTLHQLHVESGLAEAGAPESATPSTPDRLAPAEAAERVGIRQPGNIRLAVSFLNSLLEEESRTAADSQRSRGA
jgi:transcriptional regulator with XRE-family HTH domain